MPIEIVPFTPAFVGAVRRFNDRMRGTGWGWYEDPVPGWLPKGEGNRSWREYWIAVEDGAEVRGAFALKPQEWWMGQRVSIVTDWQGPVSEGLVDRRYSALALRLVREGLCRRPLLYTWGHGSRDATILQILRTLDGWTFHWTPLSLRVLRPYRFLRRNRFLRRTAVRRVALDALAFSGVGPIAIRALHAALGVRAPRGIGAGRLVQWEEFDRFGPWADELWHRVKDRYAVIAVRDSAAMNAIAPAGKWPWGIKLRVRRGPETIGWAIVLDTAMRDDRRFGDLRVGSVVDCLAAPEDAPHVVAVALDHLAGRGVDIVASNQAHPAWARAFVVNGFVAIREGRIFSASPALTEAMHPFDQRRAGLHMTNMDGHGPTLL